MKCGMRLDARRKTEPAPHLSFTSAAIVFNAPHELGHQRADHKLHTRHPNNHDAQRPLLPRRRGHSGVNYWKSRVLDCCGHQDIFHYLFSVRNYTSCLQCHCRHQEWPDRSGKTASGYVTTNPAHPDSLLPRRCLLRHHPWTKPGNSSGRTVREWRCVSPQSACASLRHQLGYP
jgi:hypothetical protein